jgi:hypothetical protein
MSMVTICGRIFSLVSDVGHNTSTALFRVTKDLRSAKAERKVTVHVLLDILKVFDLINHGLFVHMLESRYGFRTVAMSMVSSFL